MSRRTRKISPSFNVTRIDTANGLTRHAVSRLDETGLAQLDTYRTPSAAAHAAHLLASGTAEHRPHALPGCRITPLATDTAGPADDCHGCALADRAHRHARDAHEPWAAEGYATDGTRGGSFLKPY